MDISVRTTGSRQGIAGVLFSPSYTAGDTYVLSALVEHQPFERNFGFVTPKAKIEDSKTGNIEIWRHVQVVKSLRMPPGVGATGMAADAGAPHPFDGINTQFSGGNGANTYYAPAFHEWTITDGAAHQSVDLKKYRKAHNLWSNCRPGKVALDNNADVRDELAQYDFYRQQLPPGIPANRRRLACNTIAGQPKGTLSAAVGAAVDAAIGIHVGPGDAAWGPTVTGAKRIPIYGGTADDYYDDADGLATDLAIAVMDALIPRDTEPRKVSILRWRNLSDNQLWKEYDPTLGNPVVTNGTVWQGMYMGDGQTLLYASAVDPELFSHEMGHSFVLAHFVAEDVNWKHHHLGSPSCLMSYNYTHGYIWKPGGAVGPDAAVGTGAPGAYPWPLALGGTDVEHGWPHWHDPGTGMADCIHYGRNIVPGQLCAKCLLKLRGWDEEKLPVSWTHPDLF